MRVPYGRAYEIFLEMQAQETDECVLWPYNLTHYGYAILRKPGDKKVYWTHRLSAEIAYGPPPTDRHEAAHSCRNKHCFNPRHLRWATPKENQADKLRDGTDNSGERNPIAKVSEADVRRMRSAWLNGVSQVDLGKQYGIAQCTVSRIVRRQLWPSVC